MDRILVTIKKFSLVFLVLLVVLIWYAVFYFEAHQNLLVTFFDVGQGDAIFIEAPNGNQILVDGGPGDKILAKLGRTMLFGDRYIDLLVLTHPHADHLDGLLQVARHYKIGAVLETGVGHSISEYEEWHRTLEEKNVPIITAQRGQKIIFAKTGELDIFSPFASFVGASLKNPHDANIVSKLMYGNSSFLLTGDAERSLEYRLLLESGGLKLYSFKSQVLKVGHHGSKTSSSEEFLKAVSPRFAVIQVGRKNRYGHPAQEVLDRLEAAGTKILRNDLDGDISFQSNGTVFVQN